MESLLGLVVIFTLTVGGVYYGLNRISTARSRGKARARLYKR